MEIIAFIGSMASIGSAFFALLAWMKSKKIQEEMERDKARKNKKIDVALQCGAKQIKLPMDLRRADTTRAEVLGRLGMIPMKERGARFSLNYLNTPEFLHQINSIAEERGEGLLTIPCNDGEFNQFDLAEFQ